MSKFEFILVPTIAVVAGYYYFLSPFERRAGSNGLVTSGSIECQSSGNLVVLHQPVRRTSIDEIEFEYLGMRCRVVHLYFVDEDNQRANLSMEMEGKLKKRAHPTLAGLESRLNGELEKMFGVEGRVEELTIGRGYLWP